MKRSAIRTELLAIADKRGGHLSPRAVLAEARDEEHPLHACFEWDDGAAAEAFRLGQASSLIREVSLEITVEPNDPTVVELEISHSRAFYSLPSLRGSPDGSYVPASSLTESDRIELTREVLAQIEGLRRKHSELTRLDGVWREVEKASEALPEKSAKKPSKNKAA